MANFTTGNVAYADSTGTLRSGRSARIGSITITATSANGEVIFQDENSNTVLHLAAATAKSSQLFDFSDHPLLIPNGLKISTITDLVATIVFAESGARNK